MLCNSYMLPPADYLHSCQYSCYPYNQTMAHSDGSYSPHSASHGPDDLSMDHANDDIGAIVDEVIQRASTPVQALGACLQPAEYEETIQTVVDVGHSSGSVTPPATNPPAHFDRQHQSDIIDHPQFENNRELKAFAFDLHEQLQRHNYRPQGLRKLKHRVLLELQHLQTLDSSLPCTNSNIFHLNAVWQVVLNEGNAVTSIFKKYKYMVQNQSHQRAGTATNPVYEGMSYTEWNSVPRRHRTDDGRYTKSEVIVDVVCDGGARWIKVKACNPHSMEVQFLSCGTSSNSRNVMSVAESYLLCARQHPLHFKRPKFEMVFTRGITYDIARMLHSKGVNVRGHVFREDFLCVPDADQNDDGNEMMESQAVPAEMQMAVSAEQDQGQGLDETCVNLGVRCMLTMVSSLTNGEASALFFDELQQLIYGRQVTMVNDIFMKQQKGKQKGKQPEGKPSEGKPQQPETKPPAVTLPSAVEGAEKSVAWDFTYCDRVLEREPMVAVNGNAVTPSGFTVGHGPKLKLTDRMKNKKFSAKAYEEHKMLLQSYMDELEQPALPDILPYLSGKQLVCCESAWNHFIDIARISAGPKEWARCVELQKRISIVPDQLSPRTRRLRKNSTSVTNRAVFGTGDSLRILTVSAIASFVRKAEQQGIQYHAVVLPARPLQERYQDEFLAKWKRDHPEDEEKLSDQGMVVEEEEGGEEEIVVEEDELDEQELAQMMEAMGTQTEEYHDPTDRTGGLASHDDGW